MVITGRLLPPSTGLVPDQNQRERQAPEQQRDRLADYRRQQTAEYVFRGVLEDEPDSAQNYRTLHYQQIDPANQKAIHRYTDTAATSIDSPQRQGRLLDIFL